MPRTLTAELSKLRSLPAMSLAAAGTALVGAVIAIALAGLVRDEGGQASSAAIATQAVTYLQAGAIVLGILPVSQEYAGRQLGTTLAAMPNRARVLAAKAAATSVALIAVALVSLAVAWAAASLVLHGTAASLPATSDELSRLAGAVGSLVLIGMLAHATTLLLRQLIPALTTLLVIVFIAPPVLGEHARWLPGVAGAQLYAPNDTVLTAVTGALVLAAWVVIVWVIGAVRFTRRDA